DNAETRGVFIGHILQIMRAANIQKGIATEPLIKQHVINTITNNIKGYTPIKWSNVYTNLGENDELISYEVDHHWTYKDPSNTSHEMKRLFVLNPYFEIIEVSEIAIVRN